MTQTRAYLCGPMTGYPDFNFPLFNAEAARLRALGFDVVNPAEINPDGGAWEQCMRRDIAQLVTCDVILTLPGYSASRGASIELLLANALDMGMAPAAGITSVDQFQKVTA